MRSVPSLVVFVAHAQRRERAQHAQVVVAVGEARSSHGPFDNAASSNARCVMLRSLGTGTLPLSGLRAGVTIKRDGIERYSL